MSEKKVPYFICTDEETDSADESFIFTRKRKADSFFIDLTDQPSESKKTKVHLSSEAKTSDDVDTSGTEEEGENEVQVLAAYDASGLPNHLRKVTTEEMNGQSSSAVELSMPKIMSPPRVVRVIGAPYMCGDVIDLTKAPQLDDCSKAKVVSKDADCIQEELTTGGGSDDEPPSLSQENCVGKALEEPSPNQLGDPQARDEFDRILFLESSDEEVKDDCDDTDNGNNEDPE